MKLKTFLHGVSSGAMLLALAACSETAQEPPLQNISREISPAESNCLAAVANQVGVGDVSTISVSPSEAGTSVMVQVPGAEKPWNCVVDTDGQTVVNVYYMGEG